MATLGQTDYIKDYISSPRSILGAIDSVPTTSTDDSRKQRLAQLESEYRTTQQKNIDKPWYDDAAAVGKSIGKGAVVDLPEMVGRSAQALSPEDSAVSNWGKSVVSSAKARADDWKVDMDGRGKIAKAFIGGGEMLAPSLAALPAYLAGPVAGGLATVALYGGSSYQDVYDRAKASGLSDSDAHKAGLMEGAIEAGGELISNKLSLGLLGAGKKASMAAATAGKLDSSVAKPFAKSMAEQVVGENLTEGLQQYGQSQVEGKYGLGKSQGLAESFGETVGPTTAMSILLSPFGLASHYSTAKRNEGMNSQAEAIQSILDDPSAATPQERHRVVNMLHNNALKAGVDQKEADAWRKDAFVSVVKGEPIYRGDVEIEESLPEVNKDNKGLLPTGEKLVNNDLFKFYEKYNNLHTLAEDPEQEDYKSGVTSLRTELSSIINDKEKGDEVRRNEAKKVLDVIDNAYASKARMFNKSVEAEAADEVIKESSDSSTTFEEVKDPQSERPVVYGEALQEQDVQPEQLAEDSTIDPLELKKLMDEDSGFNEEQTNEVPTVPESTTESVVEPTTTPTESTISNTPPPVSAVQEAVTKVKEEPIDSSQVQAAQVDSKAEVVQPVLPEQGEASTASTEEIKEADKPPKVDLISFKESLEEPKGKPLVKESSAKKRSVSKTAKERKEEVILPPDMEISIDRNSVATKGNYSIPPKFQGENGLIKGKVVGPKLSASGKVVGYYVTTEYKNFNGSVDTSTHLVKRDAIKEQPTTPLSSLQDKVAIQEDAVDTQILSEINEEPIHQEQPESIILEPSEVKDIDSLTSQLEDLRDELEVAELADRKGIRSRIKEIESILESLGYTERQKTVKYTTSEGSEKAEVVDDEEYVIEQDSDISGFEKYSDDSGDYDFERFDSSNIQSNTNQSENKKIFDKFLGNIPDSIKSEVTFHFIPDFKTYDKWDTHGFSVVAANQMTTARGMYRIDKRDGSKHIFMNGSLAPDDFAGTFIHETVGHYGVRKILEKYGVDDDLSKLSKYNKFMVNLINSTPFLREAVISRYENWRNYYFSHMASVNKNETDEQYFSRLEKGKDYLEFNVFLKGPGRTEKVRIPIDVAIQFADEHVAEMAKELYFDEKFMEDSVGFGVKESEARSNKRKLLNNWLKNYLKKITHYLRGVFGEYTNKVSETDLKRILAKSFDSIFQNLDRDMLVKRQSKGTLTLKNTSGREVPIAQDTSQDRFDIEEIGLPEKEIISDLIVADIPERSKFIELSLSGFGNHNETVRSKFWDSLQTKLRENNIIAPFLTLGNLHAQEAYTAIHNVYRGQIARVESKVTNLYDSLGKLSPIENDAIFEYMTTAGMKPEDVQNITSIQRKKMIEAKEAINELGRISAELGLINPDTYEANKDAYLHTMYLKYFDQYRGSGKAPSALSHAMKKKKLNKAEQAALGQIKDVRFLIAETIGVIGRDQVLISMFNTIAKSSNEHSLFWTLTNEDKVAAPWDNRKKMTVDKAYAMVDNMTVLIGESKVNDQVKFDGSKTTINQLSAHKDELLKRIEALENKALEDAHSQALKAGHTDQQEKADFLRNHYVRMPNKARYGLLRNQWVRKEIYNDLDVLTASYDLANKDNVEKFFARGGTLERINRLWKMSMVALNPASWVRNIAGNFSLLDLSTSTSSTKLIGMLHSEIMSTFNSKPSEFWKLAEEYGLFGTTFSAVELQDMYSKYGDELKAAQASYESRTGSAWDKALHFTDERFVAIGKMMAIGKAVGHRTTASTSKAYALVEGVFKTVSFKDYVQQWESQNIDKYPNGYKGLDEVHKRALFAQAAAHANQSIFDYSQAPGIIKTLGRIPFGAPFLTFTYKAGPASIRAMINHPVKFAKYATLPILLTTISMAVNDWDDKDIEHFKSRLPEYYRNNPGISFFPFKDAEGRPQILPLDYILPWSQWATAARKVYENFVKDGGESPIGTSIKSVGTVFNEFGFLGGPTPTAMAAMVSGKDSFTGKSILTPGASADQQLMEAMLFGYNMAVPSWVSSHGWFSKMYQAFGTPDTNQFGEVKFTPAQAVSDITGFRTISVMERSGTKSRQMEFDMRLKEIATLRTHIIKDRNDSNKASKLKDIAIREKMVRSQMREELSK